MKNWKSMIAFLLFIFLYGWSVLTEMNDKIVESTGYIALYAMLFMMVRSDSLTKIVENLTESLKNKINKNV